MCEETLIEIARILRNRWSRFESEIEGLERARRGIGEHKRRRILKALMDYIDEDDYIFFNPS